jgi:hypothetical protein
VRDDFDDGATSNAWTRYNDWGGASSRRRAGVSGEAARSDWQTAGYLLK